MEKQEFLEKIQEIKTFCEKEISDLEWMAQHLRTPLAGLECVIKHEDKIPDEIDISTEIDEIESQMEDFKEALKEADGAKDYLSTCIEAITAPYELL